MVSFPLLTLALATISAYAKPTARAVGGLDVSLSSPVDKVSSVPELRIVATVKNAGDTDLRILKSGTVLDNQHPTRSFIVRKDGKEAKFIGAMPILSMDHLSEHDWVVIPAGKTVTAEHNVSTVYDFSATGPGTFTFEPVSSFQVIGLNDTVRATSNTVRLNIANARSASVTVTDVSMPPLHLDKRAIVDCSDIQAAEILTSYIEGRILALDAVLFIDKISSTGDLPGAYLAYFGFVDPALVAGTFRAAASDSFGSRPVSCSDPKNMCSSSTVAYTEYTVPTATLHYCPIFFGQVDATALCSHRTFIDVNNIRGISTNNLLFLALGYGNNSATGCAGSRALVNIGEKAANAASYGCFAAEVWLQTKC